MALRIAADNRIRVATGAGVKLNYGVLFTACTSAIILPDVRSDLKAAIDLQLLQDGTHIAPHRIRGNME
jgi:hypothetical protein